MHLYIHIPFCRQACHYCDFHFSTNTSNKSAMVSAIARELGIRKNYLPERNIDTIYFGGGTPSLLERTELDLLLTTISEAFSISKDAEITLEANPDDLTKQKLAELAAAGVNRLSIGIQSFHEPHLRYLNRIHSAQEAGNCVFMAQDAGITNISTDLIYAIPAADHSILLADLEKTFNLNIPHISAYCLTIEPQTIFGSWLKKNKIRPIDEDFAAAQFEILIGSLADHGYEQYEISNFARNGHYSRHNSSYWKQEPYLGVGPGAHSYNGSSREYNISNNARYIEALAAGHIPATIEMLTPEDMTNEYLLTGLRTKWGVNTSRLDTISGGKFSQANWPVLEDLFEKGWIRQENESIFLTESGKLFADKISADLFID